MKRLLLVSVSGFLFNACGKSPCDETSNVNSSSIVISFIDKQTGQYLYTETNPLYNIDSVKVYDKAGKQLHLLYALNPIPGSNSRYYSVAAGPVYDSQKDQNSFYQELCKDLFIRYRYDDIDTIKACFKSKELKCGSVFETIKISYRDTLISSLTNNNVSIINIYKD